MFGELMKFEGSIDAIELKIKLTIAKNNNNWKSDKYILKLRRRNILFE